MRNTVLVTVWHATSKNMAHIQDEIFIQVTVLNGLTPCVHEWGTI